MRIEIMWCTERRLFCDRTTNIPSSLENHTLWMVEHRGKVAVFVKKPYIYRYSWKGKKKVIARLRIPADVVEYLRLKPGDVFKLYVVEVRK